MKPIVSLKRFCAIVVGSVFFVAGTLKLIDPVGAGLVVTEYFKFLHVDFLKSLSEPVAVGMALLETLVGAALITGVAKKLANAAAMILTLFFTVLTALLAIFNPHMDCGCFGEAVHLTHFQTFLKNLVLLFLLGSMFLPSQKGKPAKAASKVAFGLSAVSTAFLTIYSLLSIPFIDFTPFGIGSTLAVSQDESLMEYDQYEATFVYEKGGREETFTLENLPDSTWTFVRTETYLVEGSSEDSEHPSLAFTDAEGEYRDEDIASGNALVISSYKPEKLSSAGFSRIASLITRANETGFTTAFIVASDPASMEEILSQKDLDQQTVMTVMSSMYFADYKTLITVNRSNGGATWFRDSEVMSKFAALKLPSRANLAELAESAPVEKMLQSRNHGRILLQGYFLYTFAVMLLL